MSVVVEKTKKEVVVVEKKITVEQSFDVTQIPADWGQDDETKPDFIKNKPEIPAALRDLEADADYRTVTDMEKNAWNGKQPAGDYATSTDLGLKVDKVDGKGLSTNDYTLTDRQKLAKIGSSSSTSATGDNATAIGDGTTASGARSFAGGYQTIASGFQSIAMGVNSQATNYCAMCFAINSIASGMSSFATGATVKAESMFSAAFGRFNVGGGNPNSWVATDPLFEIGNGTSTTPANAFTVFKNGNAQFSGTVTGADGKQLSKNDYTTEEKNKLGSAVTSSTLLHIEKKTQSEYEALPIKDPNTSYMIIGA